MQRDAGKSAQLKADKTEKQKRDCVKQPTKATITHLKNTNPLLCFWTFYSVCHFASSPLLFLSFTFYHLDYTDSTSPLRGLSFTFFFCLRRLEKPNIEQHASPKYYMETTSNTFRRVVLVAQKIIEHNWRRRALSMQNLTQSVRPQTGNKNTVIHTSALLRCTSVTPIRCCSSAGNSHNRLLKSAICPLVQHFIAEIPDLHQCLSMNITLFWCMSKICSITPKTTEPRTILTEESASLVLCFSSLSHHQLKSPTYQNMFAWRRGCHSWPAWPPLR